MLRITSGALLLIICLISTGFSDEFSGYKSRWPVVQSKAIATDTSVDVVYVGDGDTINVYNKSTLDRITFIRLNDISEGIRALEYHSDKKTLYAACGHSGVHIIDVSNPSAPTTETTIQIKQSAHMTLADAVVNETSVIVNAYDLAIYGNYLFVADYDYGLRVYSLGSQDDSSTASSLNPLEIGWADLQSYTENVYSIRNIDTYSDYGTHAFYIIALMNTENGYPVIGRLKIEFNTDTGGIAGINLSTATGLLTLLGTSSLVVSGHYAYCIDEIRNMFIIFDVDHTRDNVPLLIYPKVNNGEVYDQLYLGQPRGLHIAGDYAYIATHYRYTLNESDSTGTEPGLHIINISDPEKPVPVSGTGYKVEGANTVFVEGGSAYMTSHSNGLHKLDVSFTGDNDSAVVSEPVNPVHTAFNVSDVSIINEELLYTVDNIDDPGCGITIVRIKSTTVSDSGSAEGEGEEETPEYVEEIQATPGYPIHEYFMPTPGQAKEFCINDNFNYGYIADGHAGLQFVRYESSTGYTRPVRVPGSAIQTSAGYDVISVAIFRDLLFALTTDPLQEIWVIDVSTGTSIDNPTTYTPLTFNLPGSAAAQKIHAYGPYAMIPAGPEGLVILDANYGDENTGGIVLPEEGEELVIPVDNALAVYADPETTWPLAYLADKAPDGTINIHTIRLFTEENLSDMAPQITSSYTLSEDENLNQAGDITTVNDLYYYDGSLYIATDSTTHAVIILNMSDPASPVFAGFTSSYGSVSAIQAATIRLGTLTSQVKIKGTYIADGAGGISIMQLTDNPDSGYPERVWADESIDFCFISSAPGNTAGTGLFPVFVFLAICLSIVFVVSIVIVLYIKKHKK